MLPENTKGRALFCSFQDRRPLTFLFSTCQHRTEKAIFLLHAAGTKAGRSGVSPGSVTRGAVPGTALGGPSPMCSESVWLPLSTPLRAPPITALSLLPALGLTADAAPPLPLLPFLQRADFQLSNFKASLIQGASYQRPSRGNVWGSVSFKKDAGRCSDGPAQWGEARRGQGGHGVVDCRRRGSSQPRTNATGTHLLAATLQRPLEIPPAGNSAVGH